MGLSLELEGNSKLGRLLLKEKAKKKKKETKYSARRGCHIKKGERRFLWWGKHALEETVEEEKKKEAQKKDQWRFSEDRNQCRFFIYQK